MKVAMIGCWYNKKVYGYYTSNLKNAIEENSDASVKVITSNCSCYSGLEGNFLDGDFDLVRLRHFEENRWPSNNKWKFYARTNLRKILEATRGVVFLQKSKDCEIIHMQQVLRAFGFRSVSSFLRIPTSAKRIITVHELEPFQKLNKKVNRVYNKADVIIVHTENMKRELTNLGVDDSKIKVIYYGTPIRPLNDFARKDVIFYGGHHLTGGKGFGDFLEAIRILKENGRKLTAYIYGNFNEKEEGVALSKAKGVNNCLVWQEKVGHQMENELIEWYQKSIFCVIPYTKGSGCNPITYAMANATPVIATNVIGLPEYINGCGILVNPNSPEELAEAMIKLMDNADLRIEFGRKGRQRAANCFAWDVVAKKTVDIYRNVLNS